MTVSNLWRLRSEQSPLYYMFMSFVGWFLIFVVGVAIPSQPYRDLLIESSSGFLELPATAVPATPASTIAPPSSSPATPQHRRLTGPQVLWFPLLILVIGLSYTPSNLVLLCCFGALLGSYGVRGVLEARARGKPQASPPGHVPPLTAMLHGLCVYLAIVGGLIVVQGQVQFDSKDPYMYLRLSAVATLFSVVAGTNRNFIRDLGAAFAPLRRGPEGDAVQAK